jgi:hypothetical protein
MRDVKRQAVKNRFAGTLKAGSEIERQSDSGSRYITNETLKFSRKIGPKPVRTPIRSPQQWEAESFVKTM